RHFAEGPPPGYSNDGPEHEINDAGFDDAVHVRSRIDEDTEVGRWVAVGVRLDGDAAVAVRARPNGYLRCGGWRNGEGQIRPVSAGNTAHGLRLDAGNFEFVLKIPAQVQTPLAALTWREVEGEQGPSRRPLESLVPDGHSDALDGTAAQEAAAKQTSKCSNTDSGEDHPPEALDNPRATLEHHVLLHGVLPVCEFVHHLSLGLNGNVRLNARVPLSEP